MYHSTMRNKSGYIQEPGDKCNQMTGSCEILVPHFMPCDLYDCVKEKSLKATDQNEVFISVFFLSKEEDMQGWMDGWMPESRQSVRTHIHYAVAGCGSRAR